MKEKEERKHNYINKKLQGNNCLKQNIFKKPYKRLLCRLLWKLMWTSQTNRGNERKKWKFQRKMGKRKKKNQYKMPLKYMNRCAWHWFKYSPLSVGEEREPTEGNNLLNLYNQGNQKWTVVIVWLQNAFFLKHPTPTPPVVHLPSTCFSFLAWKNYRFEQHKS